MVERVIRTLKSHLAPAIARFNKRPRTRKFQWPRILPKIVAAYNMTIHRAINTTPTLAQLRQNRAAIIKYRETIYWPSFKYHTSELDRVQFHFEIGDKVRNGSWTVQTKFHLGTQK